MARRTPPHPEDPPGPAGRSRRPGPAARGGEVLLLPPSEGKADGGRGTWQPAAGTFPELAGARHQIAATMAAACRDPEEARRVLGLTGPGLARATTLCRTGWVGSAVLAAHARYTGVVYEHLGYPTLPASARRTADTRLWVCSGLLGLVAFGDPVPEYRCRAGLRLPLDGTVQTVAAWWQPAVTASIVAHAPARVIDLLTHEHRRMLDGPALDAAGIELVRIELVRQDGQGAAGHAAKAQKGVLARAILTAGLPATLAALPAGMRQVEDTCTGRLRRVLLAVPT